MLNKLFTIFNKFHYANSIEYKGLKRKYRNIIDSLPSHDFDVVAEKKGWFIKPLPDYVKDNLENLKTYGTLLEIDDKKELGINPRLKVCWEYVNILTPEGIKNIESAHYYLKLQAKFIKKRKEDLVGIFSLQNIENHKIGICSCFDERDCACVHEYKGLLLNPDQIPPLPLPGCDADWCRCGYSLKYQH